jgi:diaminopimelate epimerase
MSAQLAFSKYEGAGNDFVVVADLADERDIDERAARALCDRRTGIGADGTIRVTRDGGAFRMDHRNADGSRAGMCGNGIRCVGKLLHDRGMLDAMEIEIATSAGRRRLWLHEHGGEVDSVTVGMGLPRFQRHEIPMRGPAWETVAGARVSLGETTFTATALSFGNPHLVLFCDEDPDRYHVAHIGPALERHELFPERTNVEFVRVHGDGLKVRVWERGVGETMSCGTGACAAVIAASSAGLIGRRATVRFPGGPVEVDWRDDGAFLTGPVRHVFDGYVDVDGILAARHPRERGAEPASASRFGPA